MMTVPRVEYPSAAKVSHTLPWQWPCHCATCREPMKEGDGPRPPCARGHQFVIRADGTARRATK